ATITRDRVEGLARKAIAELPPGMAFIRIQTVGQAKHLVLQVGTARAEGPLADLGKSVLIMNAPDAAELLHIPGLVSRLDLFLEPGADREQVRRGMEVLLANRARVQKPETQEQSLQEVMRGIQIAFSLSGWGALIVGLFLVYNAMSVSVAERRHDIGILRSLGATREQVGMLFAGEATLMGIAGAALGVPLGLTWAYLFLGPAQRIL